MTLRHCALCEAVCRSVLAALLGSFCVLVLHILLCDLRVVREDDSRRVYINPLRHGLKTISLFLGHTVIFDIFNYYYFQVRTNVCCCLSHH